MAGDQGAPGLPGKAWELPLLKDAKDANHTGNNKYEDKQENRPKKSTHYDNHWSKFL